MTLFSIRGIKQNISLAFIKQTLFTLKSYIRSNAAHTFAMELLHSYYAKTRKILFTPFKKKLKKYIT